MGEVNNHYASANKYLYKILVFGHIEPVVYASDYPLGINKMYARTPDLNSATRNDLFRVLELISEPKGLEGFELVMGNNGRIIGRKSGAAAHRIEEVNT